MTYGLCQWILLALIAKIEGPATVGQYSLALAIVVPIQLFFSMQLRSLQASDSSNLYSFGHYFTFRLYSLLAGVVTTVAIAWLLATESISMNVLLAVLAMKTVEGGSDVMYGAFQKVGRMDYSGQAKILESVASIIAFSCAVGVTRSLVVGLLAVAVVMLIVVVFFTIPRLRDVDDIGISAWIRFDGAELLQLLTISLPLGVTISLVNFNSSLPRLALDFFDSDYSVGIFAGYAQLITAGSIVVGALGQAALPRMARLIESGDYAAFHLLLRKLSLVAGALGILATITVHFLGESLLRLLYTEEYSNHISALTILAASSAFIFLASFQGYAMIAARIIGPQVLLLLVVSLFTALGLVVFVPRLSIEGASLGVLVGTVVQCALSWWLLRRRKQPAAAP